MAIALAGLVTSGAARPNRQHCERCRGILLARTTFAEAITGRRARESGEPSPPVPLDPARARADRHLSLLPLADGRASYYGPGNVVIDSCQRCDLIWLDFGELQQITTAGGRDRGWRISNR